MGSKFTRVLALLSVLALPVGCASHGANRGHEQGPSGASLNGILTRVAAADPRALHLASQNLGSSGVSAPHEQGPARKLPDANVYGVGGNGPDDVIWFDLAPEPCFTESESRRILGGTWRLLAPGAFEYSNSAYQANVYLHPQTQCASKFRIWHRARS